MTAGACPVCSRDRLLTLLRRPRALVHQNLPAPSREHALAAPRGDLHLVLCVDCGFCFNAAFQESLLTYSGEYETGQIHSPTFRRYLEGLARDLVEQLRLSGKTIVEIGCGKGEFLSLLCGDGTDNTGIGLDPSFVPGRDPVPARCTILPVPHGAVANLAADFVLARHVIEHLPDPGALVATMRRALGPRVPGLLFLETPRLEWIFDQGAFWDVCYEHCSYFTMPVLAQLVAAAGFEVLRHRPTFGGQYQCLEARNGDGRGRQPLLPDPGDLVERAQSFVARSAERLADVERTLDAIPGRCAIWGAGAKGVTLIDVLELDADRVPVVVDINPRKQGRYVSGGGQRIVAPGELSAHDVAAVLATNPNYAEEIRDRIAAEGLHLPVVAL